MPGLVVSLGGKLDPSYQATILQAVNMAKAQNNALRTAIAQSTGSAAEKAAAYAKLDLDDEINRKIINNDAARVAIRKRRAKAEIDEIASGSGGFAWNTPGQRAGRGFLKGFAGQFAIGSSGIAQLISVASNTMSSLASGMDPSRVLAQQLPNVIQAFTLLGANAMKIAMRGFGIGTLIAGAAAIGGSSMRARSAAEEADASNKNLGNQTGSLRARLNDYLDGLVEAKKLTTAQADNYRAMLGYHEGLMRVQKQLLALGWKQNEADEARKKRIEDLNARAVKATDALGNLEEKNISKDRFRADLAAREKAIPRMEALLAKMDGKTEAAANLRTTIAEYKLQAEVDRQALKSSAPSMQLTTNQRIGAFAGYGGVTLVDLGKKQVRELQTLNTSINTLKNRKTGIPGF